MVECVVPGDWNDTLDKQYARGCIGEPAEGHTWHEHCMEHIARQMADLHRGLDYVFGHCAPPVSENGALLETMNRVGQSQRHPCPCMRGNCWRSSKPD